MSTKLLTATEARQLSGRTAQEQVEAIMPKIEEAAKEGKRRIISYDGFWANEGYSKTTNYQEAVSILQGLGYKVEFFYEERQFVNMYTIIEW